MDGGAKQWVGGVVGLLVLGGVFFAMRGGAHSPAGAPDVSSSSTGFETIDAGDTSGRIVLEAEAAEDIALPVQRMEGGGDIVAGASSGKCCWIGPDKWNESWKPGQVEGEWRLGREGAPYPGFARYTYSVPSTAEYTVWVRVYWVDDCGNSLYIGFGDSGDLLPVESPNCGQWVWVQLRDAEMKPARVRLEQGEHSLVICNREDNVYFDQILIRRADRTWPDPTGIEQTGSNG